MKIKLILKILTFYAIFFAFFFTFFMVYNLQNLPFITSSDLVLQNIISCGDESDSSNDHENHQNNFKGESRSLNEVIKSIKHDIYSPRYHERAWFATSRRHATDDLEKPLTLYDGKSFNLIQSLFPTSYSLLDDRIEKQSKLKLEDTQPKLILLTSRNIHFSNDISHCNVKNCEFTRNVSHVSQADAVVFSEEPNNISPFLSRQRSEQIWIYHNLESPLHSYRFVNTFKFNWTATYRASSVLQTPYGKFVPFKNIRSLPKIAYKNFAAGKTKLAAIFVSNCNSKNGRLSYVSELKKYAKIDVYGDCGDKHCGGDECFALLKRDYKFYLAFENSNCREYITEKFYHNALRHDVIPIVMGAHPDDYKRIAPLNSFIHVDEFNSPRQLAEYMNILDNNDDLYNDYFRWKNTGKFIDTNFICRICAMLQVAPIFPPKVVDVNEMQMMEESTECLKSFNVDWRRWV